MFDRLGKTVTRHWALVLAAWIIGVVAIRWAAPPWASISQDDDIKSFPSHFDSVVGHDLLEKAFPNDVFNSQVVVVVERSDAAFSELDNQFVETLANRLTRVQKEGERRDAGGNLVEDRFGLGEFITPKSLGKGKLLISEDKKAILLAAPCQHTFLAEKVMDTIRALRREIGVMKDGGEIPAGIEVAVTGSAGVGADIQFATNESLRRSLWMTLTLVILILFVVYRSPIVAFIPLVTIGVSVVTAMSFMALLTRVPWMHFQVMKITEIFVIVVLFGAGTDYCLFLIARYREELELGNDREIALQLAIKHVGGALAASAATVVIGLGMMVFAEFGKFRYTGPAVAISLAVALVGSLTLTPALLRLLGPVVFWPFKVRPLAKVEAGVDSDVEAGSTFQRRFWDSMSHWLVRHPATIWATSVLVMIPFAIWGARLHPTYDFLAELDDSSESKVGSVLIQRDQHFPKGTLGPLTILLRTSKDLRVPEARKDIAELTRLIKQGGTFQGEYYSPNLVAQVRSLTSPLGEELPEEPSKPAAVEVPPAPPQGGLAGILKAGAKSFGQLQRAAADPFVERIRKGAVEHYVSTAVDGRVTRLDVIANVDSFSKECMQLRDGINRLVRDFTRQPQTLLSDASHSFAGITSSTYDLAKITQSDQTSINRLVVIAIYVILVLLLRQPLVCIYLMITVLFGYFATLGITEGVFWTLHNWQHPDQPWLGLDWKVSFFLFIILVAVGEDYNILLMSRVVEEERKRGVREGVRTAVARTGGIITSCGVIMAGTFGSMATGTLAAVIQLGFALALGVLLDTFVVRPILVPAFLLMIENVRERTRKRPPAAMSQIHSRPERAVESEPVATAQRQGLIALILAWLSRIL